MKTIINFIIVTIKRLLPRRKHKYSKAGKKLWAMRYPIVNQKLKIYFTSITKEEMRTIFDVHSAYADIGRCCQRLIWREMMVKAHQNQMGELYEHARKIITIQESSRS